MTAPFSSDGSSVCQAQATAQDLDHPPRIVSVSPNRCAVTSGNGSEAGVRPRRTGAMFITPRVIDQTSFEELAATLRTLIQDARSAAENLEAQAGSANGADAGAVIGAAEFQERLRLGAKILSAFQSQIARIETAMKELEERESNVRDMIAHVETELHHAGSFREQTDTIVRDSAARLHAHVLATVEDAQSRIAGMLQNAASQVAMNDGSLRTDSAELEAGGD